MFSSLGINPADSKDSIPSTSINVTQHCSDFPFGFWNNTFNLSLESFCEWIEIFKWLSDFNSCAHCLLNWSFWEQHSDILARNTSESWQIKIFWINLNFLMNGRESRIRIMKIPIDMLNIPTVTWSTNSLWFNDSHVVWETLYKNYIC